jgi:hypothetical protein
MMSKLRLLGLSLLVSSSIGCATASTLVEVKPVPAGVASYKTLAIKFEQGYKDDEGGQYSAGFVQQLTKVVTKKKIFENVTSEAAPNGLTLTLKFLKIDRPHGASTVFASSTANAEVEIEGSFAKVDGEALGVIRISGNSKNRSRSSIGGFGITSPDDLMATALEEAADKTAEYLEKHR